MHEVGEQGMMGREKRRRLLLVFWSGTLRETRTVCGLQCKGTGHQRIGPNKKSGLK